MNRRDAMFRKEHLLKAEDMLVELPEFLEKPSRTRLIQGAVFGAIATIAIGFGAFDWTLAGTAHKLAQQKAEAAVVTALAPMCVTKFRAAPDAAANLARFNKASSWERGSFIEDGGWATFKNVKTDDSDIADACAKLLTASNT
jgi:hypothetical protein